MKHLVTCILGPLSAFIAFSASAAPHLYTFSGTIDYIEIDGAFYSDVDFDGDFTTTNDTFKVGDVVEYTFLVDFDLAGFCAGPLGTTYSSTCTGVDIPDSATANYFFTDLVSATKLAPPTEEDTTFNYGLSLTNLGWLVGDTAVFIVSPNNTPVEDWVATSPNNAGTMLIGTDAWAAPLGNSPYGRINSTLTLTSIVPVVVEQPNGGCIEEDDDEEDYKKHHKHDKKHGHGSKKHSKSSDHDDCDDDKHDDESDEHDYDHSDSHQDEEEQDDHDDKHGESYKHHAHSDSKSCVRNHDNDEKHEIMVVKKQDMKIYTNKHKKSASMRFDDKKSYKSKKRSGKDKRKHKKSRH